MRDIAGIMRVRRVEKQCVGSGGSRHDGDCRDVSVRVSVGMDECRWDFVEMWFGSVDTKQEQAQIIVGYL